MRWIVLPLAVALAPPAFAADLLVQRACGADYVKVCSGGSVTGAGATACLRQYYVSLSMPCRQALKQAREKAAAARAGEARAE